MAIEFTQEVSSRLESDHYGWLTTVAKIRSARTSAGVVLLRRLGCHRLLDAECGQGPPHQEPSAGEPEPGLRRQRAGIIVVGGEARVDAVDVDGRADGPFWAKYKADAEQFGITEAFAAYNTRLRITVDKVWTTPT